MNKPEGENLTEKPSSNLMAVAPRLQVGTLFEWFQTTAGTNLLEKENNLLQQILPELFGYHLVWFGVADYWTGVLSSPIRHRTHLQVPGVCIAYRCDVVGYHTQLPIQRDSIDVVILPHLLEYSPHPHAILREVERVLHPDGHIIILGFNPISFYGLYRMLLGFRGNMPWQGHFYHPLRIRDWLQLLGFSFKSISYTAFLPPIQHYGMVKRIKFLESAGQGFLAPMNSVYMIVAHNLAVTPSIIRPARKKKKTVLDGVIEPTTRTGYRNINIRKNEQSRNFC